MTVYGLAYVESNSFSSSDIEVISFNFENLLDEFSEAIEEGIYSVFTITFDKDDILQLSVEDGWEIYHGRDYRDGYYVTNGEQLINEDDYYGDETLEGYEDCYVYDVYERGELKLSEQVEIITSVELISDDEI